MTIEIAGRQFLNVAELLQEAELLFGPIGQDYLGLHKAAFSEPSTPVRDDWILDMQDIELLTSEDDPETPPERKLFPPIGRFHPPSPGEGRRQSRQLSGR
jgi:hypothetical protein